MFYYQFILIQCITCLFNYACLNAQTVHLNINKHYSKQTVIAIKNLDSLCGLSGSKDDTKIAYVEGKYIGEAGNVSGKFKLYTDLISAADETELLSILNDKKQLLTVRAYACMGYIYKCDKACKMIKPLHYNFKIFVQKGCVGSVYTFSEFLVTIRKRHFYDPGNSLISKDEKQVIEFENKIRSEQSIPLRKE